MGYNCFHEKSPYFTLSPSENALLCEMALIRWKGLIYHITIIITQFSGNVPQFVVELYNEHV